MLPGAELFAKRRRKSEKWIVDENTVKQSASNFQRQTSQSTTEKFLNQSNQQREQQMQKLHEVKV